MAEISNENHARLIWVLMVVLYCVIGLRYWALRRVTYDKLSPRGISSMCILATVFMVTALASITTWNLIGPYKDVVSDTQEMIQGFNPSGNLVDLSELLGPTASPVSSVAAAMVTPSSSLGVMTGGGSADILDDKTMVAPKTAGKSALVTDSSGKSTPTSVSSSKAETAAKATPTPDAESGASSAGVAVSPGPKVGSQEEAEAIAAKLGLTLAAPVKRAVSRVFRRIARPAETSSASRPDDQTIADAKEALKNVASGVGAIDSLDDIPEGVDIQVGTYQKDVDIEPKFETVWKVNFASMAIFYTALWLVKASFIVIYFEFSKDLSNRTRRLLYVSSVAMVVTYAFVMLVHLMWCLPMDKNWDYDILVNPGSCRAEIAPSVINSVINVLTDLLLMCAGFAIIRSLNLGRSDFRAASLIILIGCLTILVALVRLICLVVLMHQQNKILREASGDNNIVELPVQESIVGYPEIEAILAAMATCLPALRVLFRHSTGKTNASNSAPQTYESNATLTHTENYNPMLAKEIC